MQRDVRAFLWDVRDAANAIEAFTADLNAEGYAGSSMVHSAVERKFEIIGEALSQLAKSSPELASKIPLLPQVVAFRNQLIHGYAQIDHDTVWEVIRNELPQLRLVVADLLESLE